MNLKHAWQWQFFIKMLKSFNISNFRDSILKVGRPTADVAELMRLKNNFNPVAMLKNCNIILFKDGIQPLWEDNANRRGSAMTIKREFNDENFNWFISFVLANEDLVNGLYIKVHPEFAFYQIWLPNKENMSVLREQYHQIFGPDEREYGLEVYSQKRLRESSHNGHSR